MRLRRRLVIIVVSCVALAVALPFLADAGSHARRPVKPVKTPLAKPIKTIVKSVKNDVSKPLRAITPIVKAPRREAPENAQIPRLGPQAPAAQAADPAVQSSAPASLMPSSTSFEGLSNADNTLNVVPPDTNGDVGPNNYVEFVNLVFAVYSKTGTRLYGPADGSTLWSGFGGPCEADNDGDPIVLYDPISNRWLFSQFALNDLNGPFYQCLAVSTSSDPTGSYNRYAFKFSDTTLNDYPKFGVWSDGYYMSVVQFDDYGNTYAGAGAVVFDRAKMVAGLPATAVSFDLGSSTNPMLPADLDGSTAPPAGAPDYFGELVDNVGTDNLKVWAFHVNWTTPSSSTFTLRDTLTPASFNTNISWIDEPGGYTGWLDALADRPMYRLAYRNFGTHEAMVVDHTVNVSGHGGVRWYELRKTTGPWSIYQQSTFSPSADSRWMGSVAMDKSGNMAVGYSTSSTSVYPSIRYAGRISTDPLGALSQGEATLIAGTGIETDWSGRWGDYSSMSVDPSDDCTFWFASEYFATTSDRGWRTRIGSFKFPSCGSTVTAPTISGFSPTSGPVGSNVTITGTGFTGATSVTLRNVNAQFTVDSPTQITAKVPATGYPDGRWRVTTPAGTATSAGSFTTTAAAAPSISGFTPTSGPVGTTVTISGSNFSGATAVKLGAVAASFSVLTPGSIQATVPSGATSAKWQVTTGGGTATSAGTFTVTASAAPTISSFTPGSGRVGTTVTINGANFTGASSVTLRFVNATFTVVSPTKITAVVPAGVTSDGRWRVTTPAGTAVSAGSFLVT
jgi:IPT/TIG domain